MQQRDPEKTKQVILVAAMREIHRKGFRAASLTGILNETGLTRGALYHHFPNKKALGLAVLDEVQTEVETMWLEPICDNDDPISALQKTLMEAGGCLTEEDIIMGCPLNNLAQEMSPMDEDFRSKVVSIYYLWRAGVANALQHGLDLGTVRQGVDPESATAFFVGALAGGRGLAKAVQRGDVLMMAAKELYGWLEGMRP
jgi:TetR/AcrR family transcriptional regulator, transcriptional repressor for nem operon